MKTLVIGATGNIGSEVFKRLAALGKPVVAGVRDLDKAKKQLNISGAKTEYRKFDFNDSGTWKDTLAGVKKIFLVVPPGSTTPEQTERFFTAAREAGAEHLVFSSGRSTGDMVGSPLHVTESQVRNSDIGWTILRPGWFMQNFFNWVGFTIPSEDAFYLPASDAQTAFVDVRDIAAVVETILQEDGHEGQVYELTGTEALTHFEVAQKISNAAGRTIRYVNLNEEEFTDTMLERGWTRQQAEHTIFLYRIVRTGKEAVISDDMEEILGRPGIDFQQFADDYAEKWKAEKS